MFVSCQCQRNLHRFGFLFTSWSQCSVMSCINCGWTFQKISGRIRRVSLQRVVNKSKELGLILNELLNLTDETLTPLVKSKFDIADRSLCLECYGLVEKIEKRNGEIKSRLDEVKNMKEEFLGRTSPKCYLGKKLAVALGKRQRSPEDSETDTGSEGLSPSKPKRTRIFSPQLISSSKKHKQKSKKNAFVKNVVKYVQLAHYKTAIRLLLRKSDSARRQFLQLLSSLVRTEISQYLKKSVYTSQMLTMESLEQFSWSAFLGETRYYLPVIHSVIDTAVCTLGTTDKVKIDRDGSIGPLVPGVGIITALLLHLRRRNRFRLVQSIISAQLYRSGCSQKLQKWFQRAGLCLSVDGTFRIIDRLTDSFDKDAKKLKRTIETTINPDKMSEEGSCSESREVLTEESSAESEMDPKILSQEEDSDSGEGGWYDLEEHVESLAEPLKLDSPEKTVTDQSGQSVYATSALPSGSRRSLHFLRPKEEEEMHSTSNGAKVEGYSLTWDNVQKLAIRRHQTSEKSNTFQLWALAFMTKHRIQFHHLEDQCEVVPATTIPLTAFLPSQKDWMILKGRISELVKRIITLHFPYLNEVCGEFVNSHVEHQYSKESAGKSQVINLGVYSENPATTKGVIRILKSLKEYVPEEKDGRQYSTLVNGDQLSVERMISARMSMASSCSLKDRFEGMEPSPQEFHKRCLLLQDTMNELYMANSVAEKGTLYQIRNKFQHRGVKKNVMDCVNHTVDFLNFCTEGMLCLLAMKVGGMEELSDKPKGAPSFDSTAEEKSQFLDDFVNEILDCCWPNVYQSTIISATDPDDNSCDADDDGGDNPECHCNGKNISDTFTIECSAREKCMKKRFYHPSCVDLVDALPEEDWWCSLECQKFSAFCVCRENVGQQWIGCESGDLCISAKCGWFHVGCVGLQELPDGEWFCSEKCKEFSTEHGDKCDRKRFGGSDHLLEYSCAVVWQGLWHMAHKDIERENDGPLMLLLWKMDMVQFWEKHHYKYFLLGHRLLADVNGFARPRIIQELTWNRVANLSGGPGANIALDLVNEFLNNDFKENLKRVRGRYTEKQVQRTSRIIGSVGTTLDDVFEHQIIAKYIPKRKKSSAVAYRTDIGKFISYYKPHGLFDHIPGRCHKSFPNFKHNVIVHKPMQLNKKLKDHSFNLDIERQVMGMH